MTVPTLIGGDRGTAAAPLRRSTSVQPGVCNRPPRLRAANRAPARRRDRDRSQNGAVPVAPADVTIGLMTSLRMHLIAVVALAGCQPVSLPDRPAAERSPDRPENGATWKVVRVIDGDTLEVLRDRKSLKIRLQGIDCPERQQAFGTEATQFTSQQSIDRQVILRTSGLDRYGRTLADVHLPDGRSLSRELVRSGFAWHYKKYSDDDALSRCEREARQAKRGLWAGTDPTPP